MDQVVTILLVSLHLLTLSLLALFGINAIYLTWRAAHLRHYNPALPWRGALPTITVQLPIYNEYWVAERVIDAVARLDWPAELLEIQVLDDSTDSTQEIVAQAVKRWRAAGITITHLHRKQREGYKAGALQAGLVKARGEFIVIFDADFVPAPDFLRRTLGAFHDSRIGYLQTRWGHLNRNTSWLTYLQSLYIDGHFVTEQLTRAGQNYVMSFNGTGGIWRRSVIEEAGGWNSHTLTEDVDLSYRVALRGWRAAFLWDVEVPGELVSSLVAYRRQQGRWAQGSAQCARQLLPPLLCSSLPLMTKLQAVLHLMSYGIPMLMLVTSGLYPFLLMWPFTGGMRVLFFWSGLLFTPLMLGPWLLLVVAQRVLRPQSWWREVPGILALSFLSTGMAFNTTRAFWRGLRVRPAVFERTPKVGSTSSTSPSKSRYSHSQRDRIVWVELAFAGWNACSAVLAWRMQNVGIFLSASIFAIGLFLFAGSTLWETRFSQAPLHHRRRGPIRPPETQPDSTVSIVSSLDQTR